MIQPCLNFSPPENNIKRIEMRALILIPTLLLSMTNLFAQEVSVSNFNLQKNESLSLDVERYYAKDINLQVTSLDQVKLLCQEISGPELDLFGIMESCLTLGTINIYQLHMGDDATAKFIDSFAIEELGEEIAEQSGQKAGGKIDTSTITIRNFKLNSKHGQFVITGKMTSAMNAKLKVTGSVTVDRDLKSLTMNIRSARASFINIKDRLLTSFRDSSLDNITVEGDSVIIRFDQP
jgi:hypothetical protein